MLIGAKGNKINDIFKFEKTNCPKKKQGTNLTILIIAKKNYKFFKRLLDIVNLNKFKSNIFIANGNSDLDFKKSNLIFNDLGANISFGMKRQEWSL